MNKDIKILLVALIIVTIGAVSFNFVNITGRTFDDAINDHTSITVSPKAVKAGEFIYFNVYPGKQGVYQEIEFYRANNDLRLGGYKDNVCKSSKCFEDVIVEYKIISDWDKNSEWGSEVSRDYYARVYDIYSGKYVRTYFSVERF